MKNIYMVTNTKQILQKDILGNEYWTDDMSSNNTFFIFADNTDEANSHADAALKKLNEYSLQNERYVMATDPREIHVMSVTHDIFSGTAVTGIWD